MALENNLEQVLLDYQSGFSGKFIISLCFWHADNADFADKYGFYLLFISENLFNLPYQRAKIEKNYIPIIEKRIQKTIKKQEESLNFKQ